MWKDSSTTRRSRPTSPGPEQLQSIAELLPDDVQPPFPFWNNLDEKPLEFETEWPPDGPREAMWRAWLRFLPTATFDDPWVDATRCVILVDLPSWPSAHRPHAYKQPGFMAPTLDLNHRVPPARERARVALVRRRGAAVDGRPLRLDGAHLVARRPTTCHPRRPVPLPPHERLSRSGSGADRRRDATRDRAGPRRRSASDQCSERAAEPTGNQTQRVIERALVGAARATSARSGSGADRRPDATRDRAGPRRRSASDQC